jgi:hypothetical protein
MVDKSFIPPLVSQLNLIRIEVQRPISDEDVPPDDFITWNLYATRGKDSLMLAGVLHSRNDAILGQAMVLAHLASSEDNVADLDAEDLVSWAEWTQAEAMYDLCRRALEVQAALMDDSFKFEYKAPAASFQLGPSFLDGADDSGNDSSEESI